MYSKVKVFGRALHPMLVSFPIVLYTASFVCFVVYQSTTNPFWYRVAFLTNLVGVCAAVLAAIPGSLDLSAVPKHSEARARGRKHAILNVASLILFAFNLYLIWGTFNLSPKPNIFNVYVTGLAFCFTVAAGYLGYTLVGKNKLGVDLSPEQERLEPSASRRVTT